MKRQESFAHDLGQVNKLSGVQFPCGDVYRMRELRFLPAEETGVYERESLAGALAEWPHAHTQAHSHTLSHTLTDTHTLTHTLTHSHTHAHMPTLTHTLKHTLAHTHTLSHTHTHSHSLAHTHTLLARADAFPWPKVAAGEVNAGVPRIVLRVEELLFIRL